MAMNVLGRPLVEPFPRFWRTFSHYLDIMNEVGWLTKEHVLDAMIQTRNTLGLDVQDKVFVLDPITEQVM